MSALICGSIAYDNIMVFPDSFKNHILPEQIHILNVSFLVPEMRREFGGCALNIAYNLKLLGEDSLPMGTAGSDIEAQNPTGRSSPYGSPPSTSGGSSTWASTTTEEPGQSPNPRLRPRTAPNSGASQDRNTDQAKRHAPTRVTGHQPEPETNCSTGS